MTKSEYAKLLLESRWNEVRLRILHRDNLSCRGCGAFNCRLSVHHKIYIEGKMPWEVPDKYLVSLCDICHTKAHENRLISSFIRKPKKKRGGKMPKSKVWIEGKGLVSISKTRK
jgi:5-methylcytosine-specific restriction endonuclease McrA